MSITPSLSTSHAAADSNFSSEILIFWNFSGPDAQLGPNIGIKWRFAGDGVKKPSLAASALCIVSQSGGMSHKSDYGAALLASYSTTGTCGLVTRRRTWARSARRWSDR